MPPINVSAEGLNPTSESELKSAIASIEDRGTITLGSNINLREKITVSSGYGKSFTLDLNGYTIDGSTISSGYKNVFLGEGSSF